MRETTVWRWDLMGEAFGDTAPVQDPDGDGIAFVFDMRFPGQRYDSATGMNYNYFRDYDPATGRYIQSDPIGLDGGIATFAYAMNAATGLIDALGLAPDINLFPKDSDAYRYAELYKNDPNECTVAGHGSAVSLANLSPEALGQLIAKKASCAGKPVRLISCNAGVRPSKVTYSFAQKLANFLGRDVYGLSTWGWLHSDGAYDIYETKGRLPWTATEEAAQAAGPDLRRRGRFILFSPK